LYGWDEKVISFRKYVHDYNAYFKEVSFRSGCMLKAIWNAKSFEIHHLYQMMFLSRLGKLCLIIAVLLGSAGVAYALPPCPDQRHSTLTGDLK